MTDLHLPDPHTNGASPLLPPPPPDTVASKRQRRPSVRLGDPAFDPLPIRKPKKVPRTEDDRDRERDQNLISGWRVRDTKPKAKRVRSNWSFPRSDDEDEEDVDDDDDIVQDSPVRVNLEGGQSDNDTRNYWNGGERGEGERNGIRVWLNSLGLGRYAPVFEVHEVDDEVLPMLTIEDLKDMGINAVGSRRKMYCAIQKLSKGFS